MRTSAAAVEIDWSRVDWKRRKSCLRSPAKFLKTYFPRRYSLDFGPHHKEMIKTVVSRARHGGRQAIAAPRGCGKSELVKGLLVYLVLAKYVRFPLPIASTSELAKKIYSDFRAKFAADDLLAEDFPEVCGPVAALEGTTQRAGKQHIDGVPTNIVWRANDYLRMPDVAYPPEIQKHTKCEHSPYGGVKLAYYGLEGSFRGINIEGDRPDFILIDDPENQESARSESQCRTREETIDHDISGLTSQEGNIAIVVLTTIQNCRCLSYRLTDPKVKPAFNGLRYGMIEQWPKNMEMWDEYVALRHTDQANGDEFGSSAVAYYRKNRRKMDSGVKMLSDHFVPVKVGKKNYVLSAIQQAFNKIADTSLEAYKTEYQNNPTPEEEAESVGLTAGVVQTRISGLKQNELPHADCKITVGIDIGKYYSHWAKVSWHGNAVGHVIDYGIMETNGITANANDQDAAIALLKSLAEWRTDVLSVNPPDFCLIDSGSGLHRDAVYEFVRQAGGTPFAAAKGWDSSRHRMKQAGKGIRPFHECYASHQPDERIWLYNVNTEFWKDWLQQRFITETFDESHQLNDGTLSLFVPDTPKRHLAFSKHVTSEMRETTFVDGKGMVTKWVVRNKNNHWLDALALACAAGGVLGVRLIQRTSLDQMEQREQRRTRRRRKRGAPPTPFMTREGGWVNV